MARRPSADESAAWEVLATAARSHAEAVELVVEPSAQLPSANRLIGARKAVRNACLPSGQQYRGSPMSELVRLVDRWAVMSAAERRRRAGELRDTADAATALGFE